MTLANVMAAVQETATASSQAGISTARITLSPASLGGITISLSQTAGGLVARVIADHPEAAQVLAQNAPDLKRSLEQTGMPVLRLDISAGGQQTLASFSGDQPGHLATPGTQAAAIAAEDTVDTDGAQTTSRTGLSNRSALIDVIA
ncbi:MAG: flagellar hook-length control protein FliK [Solirubrobacteraceae bacterium]